MINGRIFAGGIIDDDLTGVPDGMKADEHGNVYVTVPGGIWVYSFEGYLMGKITCPKLVAISTGVGRIGRPSISSRPPRFMH
ncbi:hypothetical protein [Actibacterium sp. 188UL27-1]|uniref:hypothetical protein n=1 Tax=Actibacterium sp. 188UL27-1 TaxID=2786961 RepID=UPI00351C69CE